MPDEKKPAATPEASTATPASQPVSKPATASKPASEKPPAKAERPTLEPLDDDGEETPVIDQHIERANEHRNAPADNMVRVPGYPELVAIFDDNADAVAALDETDREFIAVHQGAAPLNMNPKNPPVLMVRCYHRLVSLAVAVEPRP